MTSRPQNALPWVIRSSDAGLVPTTKPLLISQGTVLDLLFVMANQLSHHLSLENPFHQYGVSSTKVTAPEPPVTTDTSACPVKATTLESAVTKT